MSRHFMLILSRPALLVLLCYHVISVSSSTFSSRYRLAAASLPQTHSRHRQHSEPIILGSSSRRRAKWGSPDISIPDFSSRAILAARTKRGKAFDTPKENSVTSKAEEESMPTYEEMYNSLGPIGKCVAGSVEVAASTLTEYITGFLGGYVLGTITDVPRFVFKRVDDTQKFPFFKELTQRYGRMHSKSFKWARSWGGISAAFGGLRVATRVCRGGKEDEWNTILSSAAAGAFFARKEGPQAMLRGALMYGGLIYLLSGGMLGGKKEPFQYRDQPVDF